MSEQTINFTKLYEKSMNAQKNNSLDSKSTKLNNIADEGITKFKNKISSDIARNTVKGTYNIADLDDGVIDCPTLMSIIDNKLQENKITNYRLGKYLLNHTCIISLHNK